MKKRFPRDLDSLARITSFVAIFLRENQLRPELSFDVNLILEELFTNFVKYNPEGQQDIEVGLERNGEELEIRLMDVGVNEFDPTQAPEVDVSKKPEERTPGGLGIHLVRKLADEINYEYRDGTSIITVTKRLED
jgi:serine/threonine-protein kinase RsbW